MKVGTGSKKQDLIGDDITILRNSFCEHDRKDDDLALSMIVAEMDALDFAGKEDDETLTVDSSASKAQLKKAVSRLEHVADQADVNWI